MAPITSDEPESMPNATPTQALAQALRDELIAVRFKAGQTSTRDVIRALGRDPDDGTSGNTQLWRFERGATDWPRYPEQHVEEYAQAAGVDAAEIWRGVARRWLEALMGGEGTAQADRISSR